MATTAAIEPGKTEDNSTPFTIEHGDYKTLSYLGSNGGYIEVQKQASDESWNSCKGGRLDISNSPFDWRCDGTFRLHRPAQTEVAGADFD